MSEPPARDEPERLRPWETTTDPGMGRTGSHALPPPSPWSSTSVIPVVPPSPATASPATPSVATPFPPRPTAFPPRAYSDGAIIPPPGSPPRNPWPLPNSATPSPATQDYPTVDYSPAPADDGSLLDLQPGAEPTTRAPARSRMVPAVIGLVILALLAGGTVLVVSLLDGRHPSTTAAPGTSSSARTASGTSAAPSSPRASAPSSKSPPKKPAASKPAAQVAATTINADVARSVAARRVIGPATSHIGACRATPADLAGLDRAARTRAGLVTSLGRLDVHTLAGGAAAVAQLRAAWTYSARADAAYAAWGRAHRSCSAHAPTKGDRNYARAHRNDTLATAAKTRAVRLWNPIARRYHLPARTAGAI